MFDVCKSTGGGLELVEMFPDATVDEIRQKTGCPFSVSPNLILIDLMNVEKGTGQNDMTKTGNMYQPPFPTAQIPV